MSNSKIRPWKEVLASLGDILPPKETPAESGIKPSRGPRPWAEILAGSGPQRAQSLPHMFLPAFFLGAGLLSRSKYFLWRGKRLAEVYSCMSEDGPRTYQHWMIFANNLIRDEDSRFHAEGYTLMYHMLLEPFALLDLAEPDPSAPMPQPVSTSGTALERGEKHAG